MSERVKLLIQKRVTLKAQITMIGNLVEKGKIDYATLRLRIARLTELFHASEEYNDELMVLEPDAGHADAFTEIQNRFYTLAGQVENILSRADTSHVDNDPPVDETRHSNDDNTVKKRRVKLPEASLPTFDGRYESWLSFKNAFNGMIGSQTDLDDLSKLQYLKSALIKEAANKIRLFDVDGMNYAKAWDLLERSYEVKRILVSRHLSALLNMAPLDREHASGFTRLADDAQQHVASLNALGVSVGEEMVVHVLEGKLPRTAVDRWEASLERDEFPKLDHMLEFLYKMAVCASRRERARTSEREREREEIPAKRRRSYPCNRVFVANTVRNCLACKTKQHPLFMCDTFKRLPVARRIEIVKSAKVCFNCLRSHRDTPCRFSNCTICQRRHNSLLHIDDFANAGKVATSKHVTAASTSANAA